LETRVQRDAHVLRALAVVVVLTAAAGAAVVWLTRGTAPPAHTGTGPMQAIGPPYFVDVTSESGVTFTYRNGEETDLYTILESLGGGVALFDYDGDGWLDIYVTGGGAFGGRDNAGITGLPGKLFRNLGGMKFRDVTSEVGLDTVPFYTHGAHVGDFDNDGWPDLLVTGYGGLVLYRNEAGQRFRDVTREMGLTDTRWTTSAAFGDLMGNGRADIYVCRYVDWSFANDPECPRRGGEPGRDVCPPQRFSALAHAAYRNDGAKFTDIWAALRVAPKGKGLGVVIGDLDADGRPDVYVANDAGNNWLFLNRGGGRLEECGTSSGVAVDDTGSFNGSMGADVGDYDGSGQASLWVTNFQGELPALYQNVGRGLFSFQSQAVGVGGIGRANVGFGTAFLDLDNDGWLDLVFVNGHVVRHPVGASFRQKPVLLLNTDRRGRRFFADMSSRGGSYFETPALGRGLAVGDLDNDGWPDLVVSHSNTPVAILRNVAGGATEHHWLGVQLVGRENRPSAGATVTLEVEGRRLTRFARGGGSYLSSSDPRLLFGLATATRVGTLIVRWPWGESQCWQGLAVDRYWELIEGEPAARAVGAIR
jgi:enediyne biosynthesis protein E4